MLVRAFARSQMVPHSLMSPMVYMGMSIWIGPREGAAYVQM